MTPEELERLASLPIPSSPATPPPNPLPLPVEKPIEPLSQVQQVLATMTAIDSMKLKFMESEQKRMEILENQITERVMAQMKMTNPERDPLHEKAMEFLINMGLKAFAGNSSPPAQKPPQTVNAPPVAQPKPQEAATEPKKQEVETVNIPINDRLIITIADDIDDHFPEECKAFREGKITPEQARAKLLEGGVPANIVDRVLESIKNIEDEPEAQHD